MLECNSNIREQVLVYTLFLFVCVFFLVTRSLRQCYKEFMFGMCLPIKRRESHQNVTKLQLYFVTMHSYTLYLACLPCYFEVTKMLQGLYLCYVTTNDVVCQIKMLCYSNSL